MMDAIHENRLIGALTRALPRSPHQLNALHESDAELVRLPGQDQVLAITADAITEEIEMGLYRDPFRVGWMTVTAAASDLAAVGAEPVGLLLIETLPPTLDAEGRERLQEGIRAACFAYGVPVLGGDTNAGACWQMAAVAVGTVAGGAPLTRRGSRPGHAVCATGPLGLGAAFAALHLQDAPVPFDFRPQARLAAGQLLRQYAACCIDTSDGALAALDQLMRLGGCGFRLEGVGAALHPAAAHLAARMQVPPWMMLAALHGEFELLFCLPEHRLGALRRAARRDGWTPLRLGTVVETPRITLADASPPAQIDTARVRNLFTQPPTSLASTIDQLHACLH